jgi:hypothetical protein
VLRAGPLGSSETFGEDMRTLTIPSLAVMAVLTFTSCMPSSMILMAARNEYSILNKDSSRAHVEKTLGAPVLEEPVSPIELSAFSIPGAASRENYREKNFLHGSEGSSGLDPKQSHLIVAHCRYVITGKIVPHGYAGDANAMGLMTMGIGELISIPMAISEVAPDSSIQNTFDVWYSKEGRALAYTWKWIEKKKEPNKAAQTTPGS